MGRASRAHERGACGCLVGGGEGEEKARKKALVGVKPYSVKLYLVLPSYPHRTPDVAGGEGRGGEVGPDPRLISATHSAALDTPLVSLSVGLWFFRAFFVVFCCSLTHDSMRLMHMSSW